MPTPKRRAKGFNPDAELEWRRVREFEIQRDINSGLGVRPPGWWRFDSGRPELATERATLEDIYGHLFPEQEVPAVVADRLRFLRDSGELRPSELAAIRTGTGPQYSWRRQILGVQPQ